MPVVRMPDGKLVRFPDEMSREEIKAFVAQKYPDAYNTESSFDWSKVTPEMRERIAANNRDYDNQSYAGRIAKDAVTGAGEGVVSGLYNAANGATLGGVGLLDRKTGGYFSALDERLQRRADETGVGMLNKVAKLTAEIGGNVAGAGGVITKGVTKGAAALSKAGVPVVSKVAGGTAFPMIADATVQGSIYGATESDSLDEVAGNAARGAVGGAVASVALGGVVKALGRFGGLFRKDPQKGMDYLRKQLGDEAVDALIQEAKDSGRPIVEVINDPKAIKIAQRARMQTEAADDMIAKSAQNFRENQINRNDAFADDMFGQSSGYEMRKQATEAAEREAKPYYDALEGRDLAPSKDELSKQNFKRWFEGSKVVDENGQPRRYYHGSLRKFDKFKQANNDYNFAPDKKFAYNYAESKGFEQGIDAEPQLYEVFLNSKKPFDFENPEDIKNLSNYIKGKKIRVFGNPKKEEEFLRNLKGEYYDTKLDEGEFEKLLSDKYNKWYSPDNHDVNYSQSSVNTDKIFSVNPDEEYFITGSAPWGYNIDDVKSSQIEDAIKNLDFGKNKRHQIPVDIETPYGNRVINIDLKRIDKPSTKNLKRGADNWIDIESADFDGEDLLDALKNMGYDGYYKQENGVKNLSVFNPNQIKSVNNSGAWSESPSLTDAGWKPQSPIADFINENAFIQNEISKVRGDLTLPKSVREASDTSFDILNMVKKNIDDKINVAQRQGENELARRLIGIKDELKQKMIDAAPEYQKALDIYKGGFQFEEAYGQAKEIFNQKMTVNEFADMLNKMTANEKKAFKGGIKDELLNLIHGKENETLGWKKVVPDAVQNKIRLALGEKEGNKLIAYANREIRAMRNYNDLLKGSQTAEKTALDKARHWKDTAADALTGWAYNGRNRGIADILTNPDIGYVEAFYQNSRNPQGWEAVYEALMNPNSRQAKYNAALSAYLTGQALKD